ncbi:ABC transporter substrate-binding protein [Virgisporangium aurantiacum]|uniref:ABC transporter substrate-binding protein n=1 Tax=Virgisporangium aurantiacum TaxID=175570 RepID=UPI001EF36040|nr:extracellular solute-binding protein [Virgisporangium aurantiacum]
MKKRGKPVWRKRAVAAVCVAVSLVIAGCGDDGDSGEKKTHLKLYNDKGAWEPFFKQVGEQSKQEIGLSMEPVGYTDEPAYEAFVKASFRTNVKPDLFTWTTGSRLEEIVKAGHIAETTNLWNDAIASGDLTENLKPYYTIGGKQYCVPANVAYWVMFYNKKILDQYNLKPPTSWGELLAMAQTLKSNGVTPFYHTSILFSFVWFQQMLVGSDPELYAKLSEGKAKYTDPGVVKVMEQWKDLIDKGYFSDPGDKTEPAALMKSGKTAMGVWGTWFNTSMTQAGMKPGDDYGMFFIPNQTPAGGKTALLFESGPLCSLDKAPDREASMKYMKWWVGPTAQEKWANSRNDVSGNPKVKVTEPGLSDITKKASTNEYVLYNRYFEATPAPVLTAALDAFGAFVAKPADYRKQLETIQKAADDYWAKHGK